MFVVEREDQLFLFDSAFDERADDYSGDYAVYRLTSEAAESIDSIQNWNELPTKALPVAIVNVADVIFDDTKRKFVDSGIFDRF